MANPMDSVVEKGNLELCKNYRTVGLSSHPSTVMLNVILHRLKPKAKKITAEEQAGFRAGQKHNRTDLQPQNPV